MKIELVKFGRILVSRPSGKEACSVIKAYFKPQSKNEQIELDFNGIQVMTPSWLDEVLTGLKEQYGDRIKCLPSENASVIASLKILEEQN